MKIKELIYQLSKYDEDTEVVVIDYMKRYEPITTVNEVYLCEDEELGDKHIILLDY